MGVVLTIALHDCPWSESVTREKETESRWHLWTPGSTCNLKTYLPIHVLGTQINKFLGLFHQVWIGLLSWTIEEDPHQENQETKETWAMTRNMSRGLAAGKSTEWTVLENKGNAYKKESCGYLSSWGPRNVMEITRNGIPGFCSEPATKWL